MFLLFLGRDSGDRQPPRVFPPSPSATARQVRRRHLPLRRDGPRRCRSAWSGTPCAR